MTSNWVHSAMVHGIHPPATPLPQGKRLTLTATSRVVASVLVYTEVRAVTLRLRQILSQIPNPVYAV